MFPLNQSLTDSNWKKVVWFKYILDISFLLTNTITNISITDLLDKRQIASEIYGTQPLDIDILTDTDHVYIFQLPTGKWAIGILYPALLLLTSLVSRKPNGNGKIKYPWCSSLVNNLKWRSFHQFSVRLNSLGFHVLRYFKNSLYICNS